MLMVSYAVIAGQAPGRAHPYEHSSPRRAQAFSARASAGLAHVREKRVPVFGKDHAPATTWNVMTSLRLVVTL
jgi:hypothetical protein